MADRSVAPFVDVDVWLLEQRIREVRERRVDGEALCAIGQDDGERSGPIQECAPIHPHLFEPPRLLNGAAVLDTYAKGVNAFGLPARELG
jgi:hypothetical protein